MIHTNDGQMFQSEWDYQLNQLNQRYQRTQENLDQQLMDEATKPENLSQLVDIDANGNPLTAPAEPVQRFNSIPGTQVAFNYKDMRRSNNIEDIRPPGLAWGTAFGTKEGGPPVDVSPESYYYWKEVYRKSSNIMNQSYSEAGWQKWYDEYLKVDPESQRLIPKDGGISIVD